MGDAVKPYYEARPCECGCGQPVSGERRFVSGHNLRTLPKSEAHRAAISAACKAAWATKRERMPLGSRRKDHNGYWLVKVREGGGRWEKEHVLVAEGELGRKLAPDEHVHHINGVKVDNRPQNLVVLTKSQHARAHGSLNALLPALISGGFIEFDHKAGTYRLA